MAKTFNITATQDGWRIVNVDIPARSRNGAIIKFKRDYKRCTDITADEVTQYAPEELKRETVKIPPPLKVIPLKDATWKAEKRKSGPAGKMVGIKEYGWHLYTSDNVGLNDACLDDKFYLGGYYDTEQERDLALVEFIEANNLKMEANKIEKSK